MDQKKVYLAMAVCGAVLAFIGIGVCLRWFTHLNIADFEHFGNGFTAGMAFGLGGGMFILGMAHWVALPKKSASPA